MFHRFPLVRREPPRFLQIVAVTLLVCGCTEERSGSGPLPRPQPSAEQLPDHPSPPAPAPEQYVGSAACTECHRKQADEYHSHPMSQSLFAPDAGTPLEIYDNAKFSLGQFVTYFVERTPDGILHHEQRVDAAGEVIYDQAMPIAFTVGSGARGRSYLIHHDGRFHVSPISWYTQPKEWGLSPGYNPRSHPRFERQASHGCIACHAGQAVPHPSELNRFDEPPFREQAIGCERCHGPGRAHLQFHAQGGGRQSADPIVNPAKLSGAKRDAVCNQCHLQGVRRVVRNRRTEFDFTPGMNLSDVWISFLKTEGIERGAAGAVSQVEQMYASQCYQHSNGALSCISCHNGHAPAKGEVRHEAYRRVCATCHTAGKGVECSEDLTRRLSLHAADSCIECHMPSFPAADVHAAQTDHRILRRPQGGSAPATHRSLRTESSPVIFQEPGVTVPPAVLDRALGIFLAEQAASGGSPQQAQEAIELLSQAVRDDDRDVEAHYLLGCAYLRLQRRQRALQEWEKVLALQPTHEDALEQMAIDAHETKDYPRARHYYEQLIQVNPHRSHYYGRFAHVLGKLGDLPGSIAAAEKCLELNPSLVQSHVWLAEAYRLAGNLERAEFHANRVKQFRSETR